MLAFVIFWRKRAYTLNVEQTIQSALRMRIILNVPKNNLPRRADYLFYLRDDNVDGDIGIIGYLDFVRVSVSLV